MSLARENRLQEAACEEKVRTGRWELRWELITAAWSPLWRGALSPLQSLGFARFRPLTARLPSSPAGLAPRALQPCLLREAGSRFLGE